MFSALIIAGLVGYLCGSIPFGLLLTRFAGLGDVRSIGSGNIGATNVLRTGHKGLAAGTLLCDILKGFVPVLFITHFYQLIPYGLVAGMAALIGHMFPVWLKFKGGKGVATYIGVALGFNWPVGLCFIGLWIVCAYLFRYSSLSALVAALLTPLFALAFSDYLIAIPLFLMSIFVFIRHKDNIERLIAGKEDKIGQKSTA